MTTISEGNLLDQKVDCIVNPWNRNLIPWWLLLPQGVSGAIKKHGGYQPFIELRKAGILPLGGAYATSAGRLPYKKIIHVAALHHYWVADHNTIRAATRSGLKLAAELGMESIAFPLIGAGTGGVKPEDSLAIIREESEADEMIRHKIIVLFKPKTAKKPITIYEIDRGKIEELRKAIENKSILIEIAHPAKGIGNDGTIYEEWSIRQEDKEVVLWTTHSAQEPHSTRQLTIGAPHKRSLGLLEEIEKLLEELGARIQKQK